MQRGPAIAGGRASPTAELRALPRRSRGPTRPRPAGLSLRHASPSRSLGGGNSYQDMETPGESGDGLRAQRCSLATPCRAHVPSPGVRALGHRTGRGEACSRGRGAAPAAEASGSREPACRPGRDLPRAAAESTEHPPVPAELSAGRGSGRPGGPRRLGEAAGRAGGGPARLDWAARRAVCGPGQARGARERRASGSDVRVSPLQIGSEGGGSGGRDANKKERAGAPAAPFARAGGGASAAQGPGPFSPPAREPRAGFPRGPTARRSCWACPGRHPKGRAESPVPPLVLKCPPPGFSALRLLSA